ncbi:MAG: sensor histidine kinase [archaeon]
MKRLNRHRIRLRAGGTLLALFALLTLSVGSTLYLLRAETGELDLFQQFLIGIEMLGLFAVAAMAYALQTQVLDPLKGLTEDAAAVANGDLDRDIEDVDRDDEIGTLTRSVREMRDQLLDLVEDARTFERAVEEAGHSVIITDREETIEYVNPAFERITGFSEAQAIGRTPRLLASGETEERVYEEMWETILDGDTWKGELVNRRQTGARQYVQQTIAPIHDADGEIENFVSIGTDVTDQKLRKQVLEVYNRVLRHNLRNRVNVVTGNGELVRDDLAADVSATAADLRAIEDAGSEDELPADVTVTADRLESIAEQIRSHTATIVAAGERLADLNEAANQADHVTRLTDGPEPAHPLAEHLRAEHERVTEEFPDAAVSISLPDADPIPCKQSMRTAIGELVDNAVEHNDGDRPAVDLTMAVDERRVVVTVADDGPGIPEYERAVLRDGEETPLSHGSGLGLWLVYWIVTMNGGRLEIEDNQPRGTRVKIDLPLPRDEDAPPAVAAESAVRLADD